MPLLAALTPCHWEVKIIIEYLEDIDFDEECDIVGIGNMGHSVTRANDIAREFKKRNKPVFAGGMMSTMLPELVEGWVDSIVIGDAEISYPRLLADFETTGRIKRTYCDPVESISDLPLPRYDLLAAKKIGPVMPVQVGRGCPHSCNFCSVSCLYKGKYLTRDVDQVIRDVKEIKRLGYRHVFFVDDNIAGNPAYFKELARKLVPLKIKWFSQATILIAYDDELLKLAKRSGCKLLGIGIESTQQKSLNSLDKGWVTARDLAENIRKINAAGIMIQSDLIIGTETDTVETLKQLGDFIRSTKISLPTVNILTPIPGTRQYQKLKKEGRLLHGDLSRYIGTYCVYRPVRMSHREVEEMLRFLRNSLYSLPQIIKRVFFTRLFFKDPLWGLIVLHCNLEFRRSFMRKSSSVIF